MSGSALAQEECIVRTWDQKLDLTIPSSEMPLISTLDSKVQTRNYAGQICCYRQELLNYVQHSHSEKLIASKLKVRKNELLFSQSSYYEPADDYVITTFWLLQADLMFGLQKKFKI